MVWLADGEKSLVICLAVSAVYRRVSDRHTDGRISCDSTFRAMQSIEQKKPNKTLIEMKCIKERKLPTVFFLAPHWNMDYRRACYNRGTRLVSQSNDAAWCAAYI